MGIVTKETVDPGSSRRGFGELEQQVLSVLWAADTPMVPREVLDELVDPPAYTTVMTILNRLFRKGLASRVHRGRAFAYAPLQTESTMSADRIRSLFDNGHDRSAVLQGFVTVLSDDETTQLEKMLRDARRRRGQHRAR